LLQVIETPSKGLIAENFSIDESQVGDLIEETNDLQNFVIGSTKFFDDLEPVYEHRFKCKKRGKMKMDRTSPDGMACKFIFRCTSCEEEIKIKSHTKDERDQINEGAVWGSVAAGIGHQQAEEFLAHMGISFMSKRLYKKTATLVFEVCVCVLCNVNFLLKIIFYDLSFGKQR